jgi:hypothetical protein
MRLGAWYAWGVSVLTEVSGYLWCASLLPSLLAVILAGLIRTRFWMCVLAFCLSTVGVYVAESLLDISMGRFDLKFRGAPSAALEIDLFAGTVFALLGPFLFGSTLAILGTAGIHARPAGPYLSLFLGGVYVTLPWRLAMPVPLIWIWIALAPIAAAFVTGWRIRPPKLAAFSERAS